MAVLGAKSGVWKHHLSSTQVEDVWAADYDDQTIILANIAKDARGNTVCGVALVAIESDRGLLVPLTPQWGSGIVVRVDTARTTITFSQGNATQAFDTWSKT